jgi:hypothetical protein
VLGGNIVWWLLGELGLLSVFVGILELLFWFHIAVPSYNEAEKMTGETMPNRVLTKTLMLFRRGLLQLAGIGCIASACRSRIDMKSVRALVAVGWVSMGHRRCNLLTALVPVRNPTSHAPASTMLGYARPAPEQAVGSRAR